MAQQTFTSYQEASLAIGQPNFSNSVGSCTQGSVNGPAYCAISSKGMLAVCDQIGGRVSLWKSPFLSNGQLPDVVLGQPSFSSCSYGVSQSQMSDGAGLAFSPDGNKLIVSDGNNNRVLIWNTIPIYNGQPADVVIGQTTFTNSAPGSSQSKFSRPQGIFVTPDGKLLVTDRYNHRVLIWNSIPINNGEPADVVIGQPDFTSKSFGNQANAMSQPWGIWVAPNGKLLIADEQNHRVLIFNSVPISNGANADVVVGQTSFGTSGSGVSMNRMTIPVGVTVSPDGKMAVGEFGSHRVLIYNSIPLNNGASADFVLGQPNFFSATGFYPSGIASNRNMLYPYNVSFDLYGRLFVVGRNMNRGMIFGKVPDKKAELGIKIEATSISICAATPTTNTITIVNNGPDSATNIVATSSLPSSFSYDSHNATTGSYNPASGYWNIPTIPSGDSVVLIINGNSTTSGTFTAYANIIQSNQLDLNLENNGTSIIYTAVPGLNCVFTDSVSSLSLCAGSPISVSYTKAGTFNIDNFFTAELSDATGSFFSPIVLDSLNGTLSGIIASTIPANTTPGTNYRIRVRSSSPPVLGTDNGINISINGNDSIFTTAPALSNSGRKITASISAKFIQYKWYRNDTVISSAVTPNYYASLAGFYRVSYLSNCGISPKSNGITFAANSLPQTISFPAITPKTYIDSPFALRATASASLPVSYEIVSGPGVLISDTIIKITNVGSIIVRASQQGNNVYDTAVNVTQIIIVEKAPQTISFPAPDSLTGTSIDLTATASSGLPIVYSVLSGPGNVSGSTLFFTGVGLITVRASQPGNEVYNAATPKDVAFCISPSQPGNISGNTEVCINSTSTYSVPAISGANFTWSIDGGGTISSSGNTASVQWITLGTHNVSVKYTTNCGTEGAARLLTVLVTNTTLSGSFIKMLPSDGNVNVSFPITFSWFPITNAVSYNIYIWPVAEAKPVSPTVSNIHAINYILFNTGLLEYGETYKWQVVAKSICDQLESPIQSFTIRHLPDLVVNNIQVPASGFSGQPISIRWEVKNTGLGATLNGQWLDVVYLSKDALLDDQDINLGTANNVSELAPNSSYVRTASFNLPQGISDNYYAIVVTDAYNQMPESNETTNNTRVSANTSAIQLTPPPDLQVTSIVPPNFAFSGQDISVTWKITNLGTGQTVFDSWYDIVYLSKEAQFNPATSNQIGIFNHAGALSVNEFYSKSATFKLPEGIFGAYYIHIATDIYNNVYEHAQEGNNTRSSDSLQVILTPPIDLVVTQITVPATAANGQSIPISWIVENQGGSSTESRSWTDYVYLSKTATFNADSVELFGSFSNPVPLASGETYNAARNFIIPSGITGQFYIYVKADATDRVFEYIYEDNNITRSTQKINIISPDLIVSNIIAPVADTSGHMINIEWKVKNNGPGALFSSEITDRIMLSTSSSYNASNIIELKKITYNTGNLTNQASLTRQDSVKLPNGISGNYFVYIHTDYLNQVYETFNNNNIRRSTNSVAITLGPWPDLQVLTIQASDSAIAGDIIPLTYTTVNKGAKAVNDPLWTDKIYLSKKAAWDSVNSTFIREATQNRFVAKDSSYTVNTSIRIPADFSESTYYFYVFADANNKIYEHTSEGNNVKRSGSIYVKKYPPVDLAVTAITAPDSGSTGAPILVRWTVTNKGEALTLPGQWNDALFLSTDTIWNSSDQLVKSITYRGNLSPDSSYNNEQSFVLPNGLAGTYYLLLVTDPSNVNNDADVSNNYKLIKQSGGGGSNDPIPIVIVLTDPPDLVVTTLSIPDEGTAGQPINVKWKVNNSGVGAVATKSWTDKIYLSTSIELTGNATLIGSSTHAGALNPGENYADSLQAFLPAQAEGNYILIFKTDANDNVYEHGAEDNKAMAPITVAKAPLSDLIVTNIQIPEMAMAGDAVTFTWVLKNTGDNPANGYMQEGVYLSEDSVKDVSDIFLGSLQQNINIPPGGEVTRGFEAELKGVSLRDYYALIYTDVLNNISETIDSNNVSASEETIMVTVPQLAMNVLTNKSLQNNKEIYYRIEVPDSLARESLLIALKGDSLNGSNEIYLRFGEVPTRAVYDYSHSQPYQGNQEIIVPELKEGTYYLMVSGNTTAGSAQAVSLLASILNFEIRMVNAGEGGNTGQVTVQISGSKLGAVSAIRLSSMQNNIAADSIKIVDPTKVFATFNLSGAALGSYDVVAQNNNGDTAALDDGFKIVAGTASSLVTNVVTPPNTRPSNVISIKVEFTNAGNTDLIKPVLRLTSLGGAPIGFNVAELVNSSKELTLSLLELNGPAGILRPGASGTIIVYAKATTVLGFMLLSAND